MSRPQLFVGDCLHGQEIPIPPSTGEVVVCQSGCCHYARRYYTAPTGEGNETARKSYYAPVDATPDSAEGLLAKAVLDQWVFQ